MKKTKMPNPRKRFILNRETFGDVKVFIDENGLLCEKVQDKVYTIIKTLLDSIYRKRVDFFEKVKKYNCEDGVPDIFDHNIYRHRVSDDWFVTLQCASFSSNDRQRDLSDKLYFRKYKFLPSNIKNPNLQCFYIDRNIMTGELFIYGMYKRICKNNNQRNFKRMLCALIQYISCSKTEDDINRFLEIFERHILECL